jgi:hypothetical protein
MAAWEYVYLLSSLPGLPSLRTARALPLGEALLNARLGLLTPGDAEALQVALQLVSWRHLRSDLPEPAVIARMRDVVATHRAWALRDIVAFRLETRVILAALRYRRAGAAELPRPLAAAGEIAERMARNWGDPGLGLGRTHAWVPRVLRLVDAADWAGIERLLLERAWDDLVLVDQRCRFEFGNVLAYVFRFDILARWLAMDRERAGARFAELLRIAVGGTLDAVA